MAPWVKCLLSKHEDLFVSSMSCSQKSQVWQPTPLTPMLGKHRWILGLQANQPG